MTSSQWTVAVALSVLIVAPVFAQVLPQVPQALEIGVQARALRVDDEDHAVNALQDQPAARPIMHLPRHGVQMKARLKSSNPPKIERQEIKEQRSLSLSRNREQIALGILRHLCMNVLEVAGFASHTRAIVDDFAVNLARSNVDQGHRSSRVPGT